VALEASLALEKSAVDGYRRTFDLLRYQRERFDLPVCTAGRVAGGSRELEGSRVREGWRLSSTGICVDATDALGRRLLPDELRKGDRVAVGGVNSPAWLLADLAVQQAGGARLEPRPVRLFSTAGMAVVEGYGLTEGSTFVTGASRFGSPTTERCWCTARTPCGAIWIVPT